MKQPLATQIPAISGSGLKIFPNPSDGKFTIIRNDMQKEYEISMYNLVGAKIYQHTFQTSQAMIDIADCPDGIYILYIRSSTETTVEKVVIKR